VSDWIKHIRCGGVRPDRTPLVTIRNKCIAFNAQFVAQANLEQHTRVNFFVDPRHFQLAIRFHSNTQNADSLTITSDGGSPGKRGKSRAVQTASLMTKYPWLREVGNSCSKNARRFEPTWDGAESRWVISVCPPFERRASTVSDIPVGARGIYRYRLNDDIVYIGKGVIRSRATSPERTNWVFDMIEYSLVDDESDRTKWETFWLDQFSGEHGRLPIYNTVRGERTRS